MSVKVKTTFNTKKMMSDIKTQAKASLGQGAKGIGPAIALAVPLAVAGLALTMFVRTAIML